MRVARASAPGVSAYGGQAGVPGRWDSSTRPGSGGTYHIPVRCQGCISHALVDTGCTETLVHKSLVRPGALLEAEWVEVRCVHGDIHKNPVASLLLKFRGKTHRLNPAVSRQVISRVGIPKEILTNQGTSFMSRTLSCKNYWALNLFGLASTILRLMGWAQWAR